MGKGRRFPDAPNLRPQQGSVPSALRLGSGDFTGGLARPVLDGVEHQLGEQLLELAAIETPRGRGFLHRHILDEAVHFLADVADEVVHVAVGDDEAVAALKRNTQLQPMSPYGWYQLARVQIERAQPDEARKIIRHLKGFEPKVAEQLVRETGLNP